MGRFDKKEPKLNEVKAVLQRLQGFPEDEKPVGQPPPAPRPSYGPAVIAGISVVLIGGVLGAAYLLIGLAPSEPRKTSVQSPGTAPIKLDVVKAPLEAARALMAKGQVRAAREQLLALAVKGSPDAAWDVARSYDPNVLATIPTADATPDIPEAKRWYRIWREIAVKEGMVGKNVSVERIIDAMER